MDQFDSPGFDYASQQTKIRRKLALANALQQQGLQPLETNRMAGGWAIPISPFEGAAKLLQTYAGGKLTDRASEEQKTLADTAQADYRTALSTALKNSGLGQDEIDGLVAAGSNPLAAQNMPLISGIIQQKRQMKMLQDWLGGQQGPQAGEGTVLAPGMAGAPQEGQQAPQSGLGSMPVGGRNVLGGALMGIPGLTEFGKLQNKDALAREKGELVNTGNTQQFRNPYTGLPIGAPIQQELTPAQQYQIPLDIRTNQMAGQRQQFDTGVAPPPMPQLGPQAGRVPIPAAPVRTPIPQAPPGVPLPDGLTPKARAAVAEKKAEQSAMRTPGQDTADKEFAKDYVAYRAAGGFSDVEKQLKQLREASQSLGADSSLTGPLRGNLPNSVRAITNPRAVETKERVEEVVQRTLRTILGAQFTEKEGERLIARSYNPTLGTPENKKRVDWLMTQIETAGRAKQAAADYFEKNGTLSGWPGKLYTMADFDPSLASSSDALSSSEKQELDALRKRFHK